MRMQFSKARKQPQFTVLQVRKLEFLMADAKASGADCVVTVGGIQSNHTR